MGRLKKWLPVLAASLGAFWTLVQIVPLLSPVATAAMIVVLLIVALLLPARV